MRASIPPFHAFLADNRTAVYRFLVAAAGREAADDCFQETFVSALRAYPRLRDGANLRGWVLAIASRKVIDAARARGRAATPVADPAALVGETDVRHDDGSVWELVRSLPARQRVAIAHRFALDRSYADVATAMGCSEQTARAHVYQGLKRLRKELRDG